jgi:hypothetical protein
MPTARVQRGTHLRSLALGTVLKEFGLDARDVSGPLGVRREEAVEHARGVAPCRLARLAVFRREREGGCESGGHGCCVAFYAAACVKRRGVCMRGGIGEEKGLGKADADAGVIYR